MGIVDEAVEDGVGVGGIADEFVPLVDRQLAGDEDGAAAIAGFEDFEKIVAGGGIEGGEAPIVEDEELNAAESAHEARVAAVAAGEGEIGEQLRNALIEHRSIVATGLMAKRTGDVLDAGLMAQPSVTQPRQEPPVAAVAELAIEQQAEPFEMGERGALAAGFDLAARCGLVAIRGACSADQKSSANRYAATWFAN